MAKLVFYDADHRYTVDGQEVPSVSELTRFITREVYEDTPKLAMDNAADRGTRIHKATEALDKFGTVEIESDGVEDDITPYISAYAQFLKEHIPNWERIEWPVHNGMLYAGTLDRYGTMDGKKVILDIKTAASIGSLLRVLYTAAQNLYRMAIEPEYAVEAIYILQLKKDGKYRLVELEIQNELAEACIELHLALRKKKKGKKQKMIKTENGNTNLNGTGAELLADYTCAGAAIKNAFEEKGMPTKKVRRLLDDCVNDAFKTNEELEDNVKDELFKLIKNLMKGDEDDG